MQQVGASTRPCTPGKHGTNHAAVTGPGLGKPCQPDDYWLRLHAAVGTQRPAAEKTATGMHAHSPARAYRHATKVRPACEWNCPEAGGGCLRHSRGFTASRGAHVSMLLCSSKSTFRGDSLTFFSAELENFPVVQCMYSSSRGFAKPLAFPCFSSSFRRLLYLHP